MNQKHHEHDAKLGLDDLFDTVGLILVTVAREHANRATYFTHHALVEVEVADDEVEHVRQEDKRDDSWLFDPPQCIEDGFLEDGSLQIVVFEEIVEVSKLSIIAYDPLQGDEADLDVPGLFVITLLAASHLDP